MPMSPRLLRPLARSGDSDVRAYIAAVEAADTQPLEQAVKDAYRDFIVGCKADGIWNAIKASCILAGARTLAGALTPLKGGSPTNVSNNFVSGDYDRKTGLKGNATNKSLDTGRNNDADPQNSKHMAVYVSDRSNDGGTVRGLIYAGDNGTAGSSGVGFRNSDSLSLFQVNNQSASFPTIASLAGLAGVSRSNGTQFVYRANGADVTVSVNSHSPISENVFLYRRNNANFTSARLAFYSVGESLNLSLLDSRVSALYTAIGNAI
jgi:hypothetical protein